MSEIDRDLVNAAIRFLDGFENVFHHDWEHTKQCLSDETLIHRLGTFCKPAVEDEANNWSSRGALLDRYQEFAKLVRTKEIKQL